MNKEGKIIGLGGVFFKSKNPDLSKQWYSEKLGLNVDQYGATFVQRKVSNPDQKSYTQWSPFAENTNYFKPSTKDFMVNFRVQNIESLVENLKSQGVTVIDEISSYEYGKFVHILDVDGVAIELWEPIDEVFDDFHHDIEKLNYE